MLHPNKHQQGINNTGNRSTSDQRPVTKNQTRWINAEPSNEINSRFGHHHGNRPGCYRFARQQPNWDNLLQGQVLKSQQGNLQTAELQLPKHHKSS